MLLTSQNRFASVFARCAPISGPSSQRPRFGAKPCNRRVNPTWDGVGLVFEKGTAFSGVRRSGSPVLVAGVREAKPDSKVSLC